MVYLTKNKQVPDLDLQPIIKHTTLSDQKHAKIGNEPIRKIFSDGETVVAYAGRKIFAFGAYCLSNFKTVSQAKATELIGKHKPPLYEGTTVITKHNGGVQCTLQIKKRKGVRTKYFSTSCETIGIYGQIGTSFCTSRDGKFLYWGLPDEIRIHELVSRHTSEIARIPLPDAMPSALASTPGLLVVGTAQGTVYSLSFQMCVPHFILDLASEELFLKK